MIKCEHLKYYHAFNMQYGPSILHFVNKLHTIYKALHCTVYTLYIPSIQYSLYAKLLLKAVLQHTLTLKCVTFTNHTYNHSPHLPFISVSLTASTCVQPTRSIQPSLALTQGGRLMCEVSSRWER